MKTICQMCKSRAATTRKNMGGMFSVSLCDDCATRAFSSNVFNEKYRSGFWQDEHPSIKCDVCKTELSDFEETGYVGCENCYKTFDGEVLKFVREINGKDIYVGKIPEKLLGKITRSAELRQLREKLEAAISNGDRIEEKQIKAKILKIGGVYD